MKPIEFFILSLAALIFGVLIGIASEPRRCPKTGALESDEPDAPAVVIWKVVEKQKEVR